LNLPYILPNSLEINDLSAFPRLREDKFASLQRLNVSRQCHVVSLQCHNVSRQCHVVSLQCLNVSPQCHDANQFHHKGKSVPGKRAIRRLRRFSQIKNEPFVLQASDAEIDQ
jgi:hypothetical protein